MRRQTGVERLMLHGLDERGVVDFLERTAGHDLDGPGLALAACGRSRDRGQPVLHRRGAPSPQRVRRARVPRRPVDDATWNSSDVGIPEGVREVIGRRLSHLDAVGQRGAGDCGGDRPRVRPPTARVASSTGGDRSGARRDRRRRRPAAWSRRSPVDRARTGSPTRWSVRRSTTSCRPPGDSDCTAPSGSRSSQPATSNLG